MQHSLYVSVEFMTLGRLLNFKLKQVSYLRFRNILASFQPDTKIMLRRTSICRLSDIYTYKIISDELSLEELDKFFNGQALLLVTFAWWVACR